MTVEKTTFQQRKAARDSRIMSDLQKIAVANEGVPLFRMCETLEKKYGITARHILKIAKLNGFVLPNKKKEVS